MYGVIASVTFNSDIIEGIEQEPIYHKFGKMSEEDFVKYCLEAGRVTVQALVIDMDATENESSIVRGIRQYKMIRPVTRIIVLAVDRKPGNRAISDLVGLGIHDIIAPSISETDEDVKEFDITPFISEQLNKRTTYADVGRWHFLTDEIETPVKPQQRTKTKTITNIKNIERVIEKRVIQKAYQVIPSKVVVIGSLYNGAGSTILSTNIARMVARRGIDVAYVEHPLIAPYMFDYLQIHAQEDRPYVDISREIKEDGILKSAKNAWVEHGVKWHVIDTRMPPLPSFSYENLLVLSHSMQTNVLIIDISNRWLDPEIQKFLYLADTILMCVEPDPVKYVKSIYDVPDYLPPERMIMDFLNNDKKLNEYELVLMKDVKGLDNKLVKEMLHKKPVAKMPYIPYRNIQKALFKMKLLYDFEDNAETFENVLVPVIAEFIPSDFIDLTIKRGLVKRLFDGFRKSNSMENEEEDDK